MQGGKKITKKKRKWLRSNSQRIYPTCVISIFKKRSDQGARSAEQLTGREKNGEMKSKTNPKLQTGLASAWGLQFDKRK